MTAWTSEELTKIDAANELEIAPVRSDGTTLSRVPLMPRTSRWRQ